MKYSAFVFFFVLSQSGSANLIVNGSFENPVITSSFLPVPNGSGTIAGWTVTGISVDIVNQNYLSGYPARDGNQFIDLAGTPGPGHIEQSFATTMGQSYNVYFSGSTNNLGNQMQVYLNGSLLYNITTPPQGTWVDYGFSFQATSNTSSIGFGTAITGNQGPLVDRVIVEAIVPEPVTGLVLSVGAAGLLFRRGRRN